MCIRDRMYHVNGEEVGYGIASYKPKDGDVLRFQFTMYGYGTDLTGRAWGNPEPIINICNKDEIDVYKRQKQNWKKC